MTEIQLSKIRVTKPHLRIKAKIEDLIESIESCGIINPLSISTTYELLAGGRRYAAAKKLGLKTVPVRIINLEDLEEELLGIDENLIRLDYTSREYEKALVRRKEIYELKHPESKNGGDRISRNQKLVPAGFVRDTSQKTGRSRSVIGDAVRREQKSSEKVKKARDANELSASQASVLVVLDKKQQDQLLPIIKDKSVSEIKEIVKKAEKQEISEIVEEIKMMDGAIKLFSDIKSSASRLKNTIARGIQEEIFFCGPERLEIVGALTALKPRIDKFLKMQQEGK